MEINNDLNKSKILNNVSDSIYRDALKGEGIEPTEFLLGLLKDLHHSTLTPSLVLRAYNKWRLGRRREGSEGL